MRRSFVALALALVLPLPALAGQVTVKEGETLSEIADRYGISVSRLMQINGIQNADLVEAGRKLQVPGGGGGGASRSGGGNGRVTVQDGETLSEIADRHGMSVSRLIEINGISDPDHVEAGRTLVVTGRAKGGSSSGSGSSYRKGASEHVVRSGESLSVIADGYGIGLSKLIAINAIADPDLVEAGTRLRLKGNPAVAKPATPKPVASRPVAPAPRPRPVETAVVAPRPEPRPAPIETATITPTVTPAVVSPKVTPTPARPVSTPVASKPTVIASAPKPASTVTPGGKADWRTYGPLQVDWSNWQPMGGSMVAPTLNSQGESLYMAINCGARKINATSQAGLWKTWDDPQADFEQQLVNDYCKNRPL